MGRQPAHPVCLYGACHGYDKPSAVGHPGFRHCPRLQINHRHNLWPTSPPRPAHAQSCARRRLRHSSYDAPCFSHRLTSHLIDFWTLDLLTRRRHRKCAHAPPASPARRLHRKHASHWEATGRSAPWLRGCCTRAASLGRAWATVVPVPFTTRSRGQPRALRSRSSLLPASDDQPRWPPRPSTMVRLGYLLFIYFILFHTMRNLTQETRADADGRSQP